MGHPAVMGMLAAVGSRQPDAKVGRDALARSWELKEGRLRRRLEELIEFCRARAWRGSRRPRAVVFRPAAQDGPPARSRSSSCASARKSTQAIE